MNFNPGSDLVLLNALLTEVVANGWHAKDFIAAHTSGFDEALAANKTGLEEAAGITGLSKADIQKAARWIAEPKAGGKLRRTMLCYEKGLIWGNDNYRTNAAIANLCFATHNVGREGTGWKKSTTAKLPPSPWRSPETHRRSFSRQCRLGLEDRKDPPRDA